MRSVFSPVSTSPDTAATMFSRVKKAHELALGDRLITFKGEGPIIKKWNTTRDGTRTITVEVDDGSTLPRVITFKRNTTVRYN